MAEWLGAMVVQQIRGGQQIGCVAGWVGGLTTKDTKHTKESRGRIKGLDITTERDEYFGCTRHHGGA